MGKSPEFLSGCTLSRCIAVDFTCDGAAFGSYWFDDHVRAGFPMALRSPWLDARINVDKTPAYSDMPRDVRHTAIFNTMPFLDRLRARYDTFVVRPGPQPYSETVRLGYPGASLVSPKGRRLVEMEDLGGTIAEATPSQGPAPRTAPAARGAVRAFGRAVHRRSPTYSREHIGGAAIVVAS